MKNEFSNSVMRLFVYFLAAFAIFLTSCGGPECSAPSSRLGNINVDANVFIGGPTGSCPFPNGTQFINAVNTGTSAFASSKANNSTKFITEIIVSGTCSNGAGWTEVISQNQITLASLANNRVRFSFNPATTSNNEYTVTIRVLTPCVSGTCGNFTSYREVLSPDGFKISNPAVGSTFLAPKLLAGVAEESCE